MPIFAVSGDAPAVVSQDGDYPANLIHDGRDDMLAVFSAKKTGANNSVRSTEVSQPAKYA